MFGLVAKLKGSYFWTSLKVGKYTKRRSNRKNAEFEPQSKKYYEETYRDGTYLEPAAMSSFSPTVSRSSSVRATGSRPASPSSPYWANRPWSAGGSTGSSGFGAADGTESPAALRRSRTTAAAAAPGGNRVIRSSEQYNAEYDARQCL